MSITLLSLADAYEREARGMWTSQRDRWALRDSAALFRRMACNRRAADPTRLKLDLALLLDVAERWCRQHGYKTVVGHGGWVIQRAPASPIVASFGDTLIWDGEHLRIEDSP